MIYLSFFDIDERVIKASEKAMELCKDKLAEIDNIQEYNQQKMIKLFSLQMFVKATFGVLQATDMMMQAERLLTRSMPMFLMQKTHLSVIIS